MATPLIRNIQADFKLTVILAVSRPAIDSDPIGLILGEKKLD
jgi:hypothetical protein